ncbi:Pet127-domain-containing protein [Artomyces pyxidatus]|uniref:Pet127-domain-containing protein n=1 Tax=Artomyces pyxidatus TaxID=48021 RepID=A0ACB8SUB9_9AGAM|nr:Pet127-domain-containing protein [Artomyces pyxidatus]
MLGARRRIVHPPLSLPSRWLSTIQHVRSRPKFQYYKAKAKAKAPQVLLSKSLTELLVKKKFIQEPQPFEPQPLISTKQERKRLKRQRKKAAQLALESVFSAFDTKPEPPLQEDEHIEPPEIYLDKDDAPHLPRILRYIRRIEGVLQPLGRPVLEDLKPPSPQRPIANLTHGLDRVLFNPGVHWLKDPRSRVYNFTTWLKSIPSVKDFAFERIPLFVRSSGDQDMWSLAKAENRRFIGSTSSLSGLLSQIYFLISEDKPVDTSSLSRYFQEERATFTFGQRIPVSVVLRYNDGVYGVDSDDKVNMAASKNPLLWMGHMLEKFLTVPPEEFSRFMRASDNPILREENPLREAYRYSKSDKFVMRSQLDCVDPRLPGTGVFDVKTRAALPVRKDLMNYEENAGYLIRTSQGPVESFEREYYDLIRSAFLKYSFQARIGNMDGVFVAYHNTERMFGFQYIPLLEMDARIYGGEDRGERVFEKCVSLLEIILTEAVYHFPNESIRILVEKQEGIDEMKLFAEPAEWAGEGDPPLVQLNVSCTSFVGREERSGARIISLVDEPWTLLWTITTSSLSQSAIRDNLTAAKNRQALKWSLPTGVSTMKQMKTKWNEMEFNPAQPDNVKFNPLLFTEPKYNIRALRKLARSGREDSMREAQEDAGAVAWRMLDQLTINAAPPLGEQGVVGKEPEALARAEIEEVAVARDGEAVVGAADIEHDFADVSEEAYDEVRGGR